MTLLVIQCSVVVQVHVQRYLKTHSGIISNPVVYVPVELQVTVKECLHTKEKHLNANDETILILQYIYISLLTFSTMYVSPM